MDYANKLNELNNAFNTANENAIVCQTNIDNINSNIKTLEEECKQLTGSSLDNLQDYIDNKKKEIDDLLSLLDGINFSDIDNLSDDDMLKLQKISFKEGK